MKNIRTLLEYIEADLAEDDYELDCQELIYKIVDKNFKKFRGELKSNKLALAFAEALAFATNHSNNGYFPELIADTLPHLDTRTLKRVYSFLKNIKFAKNDKELFSKARQAAGDLQDIGDKYFPHDKLMNITGNDEGFVWGELYPEFWRYLLVNFAPDERKRFI